MPTKLDIKRKSFLKHPEPSVIPKYILWFKSNQNSASNYFRQVAKQIENSARLHKKKKDGRLHGPVQVPQGGDDPNRGGRTRTRTLSRILLKGCVLLVRIPAT